MNIAQAVADLFEQEVTGSHKANGISEASETPLLLAREAARGVLRAQDDEPHYVHETNDGFLVSGARSAVFLGNNGDMATKPLPAGVEEEGEPTEDEDGTPKIKAGAIKEPFVRKSIPRLKKTAKKYTQETGFPHVVVYDTDGGARVMAKKHLPIYKDFGFSIVESEDEDRTVLNEGRLDEALNAAELAREFQIDDDKAKQVVNLVRGGGRDRRAETVMDQINDLIGGHGVESIRGDGPGGFWQDSVAIYVNTGDTYSATILYDTTKEKFALTTMGDFVEQNQDKYQIESVLTETAEVAYIVQTDTGLALVDETDEVIAEVECDVNDPDACDKAELELAEQAREMGYSEDEGSDEETDEAFAGLEDALLPIIVETVTFNAVSEWIEAFNTAKAEGDFDRALSAAKIIAEASGQSLDLTDELLEGMRTKAKKKGRKPSGKTMQRLSRRTAKPKLTKRDSGLPTGVSPDSPYADEIREILRVKASPQAARMAVTAWKELDAKLAGLLKAAKEPKLPVDVGPGAGKGAGGSVDEAVERSLKWFQMLCRAIMNMGIEAEKALKKNPPDWKNANEYVSTALTDAEDYLRQYGLQPGTSLLRNKPDESVREGEYIDTGDRVHVSITMPKTSQYKSRKQAFTAHLTQLADKFGGEPGQTAEDANAFTWNFDFNAESVHYAERFKRSVEKDTKWMNLVNAAGMEADDILVDFDPDDITHAAEEAVGLPNVRIYSTKRKEMYAQYYVKPGDKAGLARVQRDLKVAQSEEPNSGWRLETRGDESTWHEWNESTDEAKLSFDDWMKAVNKEVEKKTGDQLSADDLPDVSYSDWHEQGMTPARAAAKAIRMADSGADEAAPVTTETWIDQAAAMSVDEFVTHMLGAAENDLPEDFKAKVDQVVERYKCGPGKKDMARKITAANPVIKKKTGKGVSLEFKEDAAPETSSLTFPEARVQEFLEAARKSGAGDDSEVVMAEGKVTVTLPKPIMDKVRVLFTA
jgi:hypothetical protein